MKLKKINGNDLIALGFQENHAIGIALKINTKRLGLNKEELLSAFKAVLENPEAYLEDKNFKKLAAALVQITEDAAKQISLKEDPAGYAVYGAEQIEESAKMQMQIAMQLPVAVAGALMPDAHQGYGLPIGGVLATENAVIPYGVGVDIGCRMALSIFDLPDSVMEEKRDVLKDLIVKHSRFGAGVGFEKQDRVDHAVLEHPLFSEIPFIKNLKDKAWSQLGSSGGGNHFVEFGIMEFEKEDQKLGVPKGKYLALLTHSGSRGLGATIANHYTRMAKEICVLPDKAKNLAYLDLNTQAGQEYWLAMNLAGDYASACHEVIHEKLRQALSAERLAKVENHHNFAWKEKWNDQDLVVHRKGATPAAKDVMGIIPGSMATAGFLVRGKGAVDSINSASHGAGRMLSRTKAMNSLDPNDLKQLLRDQGITLIGADMDEAPMAYKDIHTVMAAQSDLVEVVASFAPKIVRMADDGSKED